MNAPLIERKFARAYLGDPESREAVELRRQIAKGAREALEEQYWDVIERTLQARPTEARLGGDPSVSNKIRAYVLVRHYRNGEWEDRIEVRARRGAYSTTMPLTRQDEAPSQVASQERESSVPRQGVDCIRQCVIR